MLKMVHICDYINYLVIINCDCFPMLKGNQVYFSLYISFRSFQLFFQP